MDFGYLLNRIHESKFEDAPFRHIQINNFFSDDHLKQIVEAKEIAISGVNSDEQLFSTLFENGYKIIDFPGCITYRNVYLKWHKTKDSKQNYTNSSCEGFGMTLRLMEPQSPIISELAAFMNSKEFQLALADKFDIDFVSVFPDAGIQKYLDGYEISPHPDIRKKALTYMVNINPGVKSEDRDHHTHYLKFRDEYKYVESYWNGRPDQDRCWVPWDWCETHKMQRENNSIVIFSPRNNTIHGVKASYDHLSGQRTQMYGNLWYHEKELAGTPAWEDFVIEDRLKAPATTSVKSRISSLIPKGVKAAIKGGSATKGGKDSNVSGARNGL